MKFIDKLLKPKMRTEFLTNTGHFNDEKTCPLKNSKDDDVTIEDVINAFDEWQMREAQAENDTLKRQIEQVMRDIARVQAEKAEAIEIGEVKAMEGADVQKIRYPFCGVIEVCYRIN